MRVIAIIWPFGVSLRNLTPEFYNILEELIKNKNYNVYATFNHKHKNLKRVKWMNTS